MDRYIFPGYPDFLERAIGELGFPVPFTRGRIPQTLAGLANLCAQASDADPDHVAMILHEAASLRDQLLVASRAAELMLGEVSRARGALPEGRSPGDSDASKRPGKAVRKAEAG